MISTGIDYNEIDERVKHLESTWTMFFVLTNRNKYLQRKIGVEEELSYRASLEDLYFQIHTKLKHLLPIDT